MNFYSSKSLSLKLIINAAVPLAGMAALSFLILYTMSNLKTLQDDGNNRATSAVRAQELQSMPTKLYSVIADLVINQDFETNRKQWRELTKEMDEDLDYASKQADTEKEKSIINQAKKISKIYVGRYDEMFR